MSSSAGSGLGYTAVAALRDDRVRSLAVIDALPAVIDWHERELLPVSGELVRDPRTTLVHDDFFAVVRRTPDPADPRYDAILLDVDHSPRHQLDPTHADLYTVEGLTSAGSAPAHRRRLRAVVRRPAGRRRSSRVLRAVFDRAAAHVVDFANPLTGGTSSNTVYVGVSRGTNGPIAVPSG